MIPKQSFLFIDNASSRKAPEGWLTRSAAIAQRITSTLRARRMMQKELAETIGIKPQQVSKILKGNVNLTLGTISKLEAALGINLVEVSVHDIDGSSCPAGKRKAKAGLSAKKPVYAAGNGAMLDEYGHKPTRTRGKKG
jgi:ribosome-binding protein aMBF1 (putative translation factor)